MFERTCGLLLHPTSLPGPPGVGDLGEGAHRFVDFLADARIDVWQMLPTTAPGAFGSPYDCRSGVAGNWLLISPDAAAETLGVRTAKETALPQSDAVSFPAASAHKEARLRALWARVRGGAEVARRLTAFRDASRRLSWLEDWALFAALDRRFDGRPWTEWPPGLRDRETDALAEARRADAAEIEYQVFLQWLFHQQTVRLRDHARGKSVRLFGDLPFYPAHHSVDAWTRPDLFELDTAGRPAAVAGVPPDAFSEDGQLWGNPVYRWPRHRASSYAWWLRRLAAQAARFDLVRLDHFRGFVAYWRVPWPAETARAGSWRRGPGMRLFDRIAAAVPGLALVAEDLGHVTRPVRRLRERLGLPGMRVLQFGFGRPGSPHHPAGYDAMTVAYTGTHDNDTLVGWLDTLDEGSRERVRRLLDAPRTSSSNALADGLVHHLLDSSAGLAVLPVQDVLGLGATARMNTPGTAYDNWRWRLRPHELDENVTTSLCRLVAGTGRQVPG